MSPSELPTTSRASTTNKSRSVGRVEEERGGWKGPQHERSTPFHGRTMAAPATEQRQMRRPKTQPNLLAGARWGAAPEIKPRKNEGDTTKSAVEWRVPAKVLVNVTVQGSLGAVQVMASTEWTVVDLVGAAVRLYVKEGRRPPLPTTDPSALGLHYSQFNLECLDPKEKLMGLGSRNFFLCPESVPPVSAQALLQAATPARPSSPTLRPSSSPSCSKEAGKGWKIVIPWLEFWISYCKTAICSS